MSKKSSKKPKDTDSSESGGGGGGGTGGGGAKKKAASSASALATLGGATSGGFGSGFGAAFMSVAEPAAASADKSGSSSSAAAAGSSSSRILECEDGDINFVYRKLLKRDSTTKSKALDELRVLFESKPASVLMDALPSWCNHYDRLSLDNDRKIRESLYATFTPLITGVSAQKGLARHIRSLFPNWWFHQYDTSSRDVQKAAKAAWDLAFPIAAKFTDVLKYCQSEYYQRVSINLAHTIETLSDMKITSKEDAEERFERVVCSTLTSLAHFIEALPEDANHSLFGSAAHDSKTTPAAAEHADILSANTWKLALPQSSSKPAYRALVRKSVLSVIKAILTRAKLYVEKPSTMRVIVPIVFGSVCTEPMSFIHPLVWELFLYLLKHYPNCWQFVAPAPSAKSKGGVSAAAAAGGGSGGGGGDLLVVATAAVLNKLIAVISSGGFGSPRVMYPYLMPLLSCIPQSVITAAAGAAPTDSTACTAALTAFYNQVLSAVWSGLRAPSHKASAAPAPSAAAPAPGAASATSAGAAVAGSGAVTAPNVAADSKLVIDTYFECVHVIVATTK